MSLIHGTRITDDLPEETENDHECAFPQLTCDTQRVSGLEGLGYKAWMTRGVRVSETLGLLGISLDVSEAATGIKPCERPRPLPVKMILPNVLRDTRQPATGETGGTPPDPGLGDKGAATVGSGEGATVPRGWPSSGGVCLVPRSLSPKFCHSK